MVALQWPSLLSCCTPQTPASYRFHPSFCGSNSLPSPTSRSNKLPGTPLLIAALPGKAGQAEMTTDQGAIYVTDNAAYTWSAAVQETVDATLNRTVSSGGFGCVTQRSLLLPSASGDTADDVACNGGTCSCVYDDAPSCIYHSRIILNTFFCRKCLAASLSLAAPRSPPPLTAVTRSLHTGVLTRTCKMQAPLCRHLRRVLLQRHLLQRRPQQRRRLRGHLQPRQLLHDLGAGADVLAAAQPHLHAPHPEHGARAGWLRDSVFL